MALHPRRNLLSNESSIFTEPARKKVTSTDMEDINKIPDVTGEPEKLQEAR